MSKQLIYAFVLVVMLSACNSSPQQSNNAFSLILLPPLEGPAPALFKQKLTMIAKGHTHELLVLVKIQKALIKIRGLLPTGQTVYTIEYNGEALSQQSPSGVQLPSEDILTMLQFALWPPDALFKYYLPSTGWMLEFGDNFRVLSLHGNTTLRVSYINENTLVLENYVHQYKVEIETLEYISL